MTWTIAAHLLSLVLGIMPSGCASGVSENESGDSTLSPEIWPHTELSSRSSAVVATSSEAQLAQPSDTTWATIADESDVPSVPRTFSLPGTQTVQYGAEGQDWVALEVTGPGECSNAFFRSDPAPGHKKVCKAKRTAISAASDPTTQTSSPSVTRTESVTGPPPAKPSAGQASDTLRVSGRTLLDTCGQPFVARGVENFLWKGTDFGPTLEGVVDEIAETGANAVRLLPDLDSYGGEAITAVDKLITTATSRGMVVYLSIGADKRARFYEPAFKQMLDKHKKWLIIDLYGEPTFDDRARWKQETLQAIREFRSAGYTVPVTMIANQGGRDLDVLLSDGDEVVAADSAHNTILGWQAYWGEKGFYMDHYGMSLEDALDQIAALDYPVQIGILQWADGDDQLDYRALMAMAERHRVGWLWWDFFLPPNTSNSLSTNGTAESLSPWGQTVIRSDPNGIARTAKKACGR